MILSSTRFQICALVVTAVVICFGGRLDAELDDVVISELQPVNDSTHTDEYGNYSDWLEIYNAGPTAVDLGGCYLTDDPTQLTRWRFPSRVLEARRFLVVFCSGRDIRDPTGELHTSFGLSGDGEFVALVAPDGQTLLSAHSPTFPSVPTDFSYGFRMEGSLFELVNGDSNLRVLVPEPIHAGFATSLAWTEVGFFDGGWHQGTLGVGYDTGSQYLPLISTDVRASMETINTSIWVRIPFVIDDPADVETLTLHMKYDDGFIAYINGNFVADGLAPSSPAPWNAVGAGDHQDADALVFERWDFAAAGLLQAGTNILAVHGLNRALDSSDFLLVAELDGFQVGELDDSTLEFFDVPTPGTGNVPGYSGVSPTPTLLPANEFFVGSTNVFMTVPPGDAEIRYTLDRSEPTESSPLYANSITVSDSTFVRARSFTPGEAPSPVVSGSYMTMSASLASRSSSLPIVVVDTLGNTIPDTNSTVFGPAIMAIFDRAVDGRSSPANVPDIVNSVGIRERGSSSSGRPKKSYRFEFWDDENDDRDLEPLGLPRQSDWILYGAYNFDRTHMRNPFIYELSRQVGRYASRTRFVEVYLNTNGGAVSTGDYWGVYSLCENIKRGDDRVDVERLDPSVTTSPELEGGYILKHDRADPDGSGTFFAGGVGVQFVYPDDSDTNAEQRAWIEDHLDEVLTMDNFLDVIDPLAAIDHHILNAMPKNVDAFRLSGYFYKPRNGKVTFGPIWDFDRSMDSTDSRDNDWNTWAGPPDSTLYFEFDGRTPYWSRWLENRDFLQMWIDRWYELRRGPMSTLNIFAIINSMRSELIESALRDQSRWNQTSNWSADVTHLRTWLANRVEWIDDQWREPVDFDRDGGPISPGAQLTLTTTSGTIYWTSDGSDPRLPGGGIAPGAAIYAGPIVLDANARVVARSRINSADWSAVRAETFVVTTPPLVITELMFHSAEPDVSSAHDADDFEFVEVLNRGTVAIDMNGARLSGGIEFTFSNFVSRADASLLPGERVVVVNNLAAFETRYDTSDMTLAGEYARDLGNASDRVIFEGPLLEPIHDFQYLDSWSELADGLGHSLTVLDPFADFETWNQKLAWVASTVDGGTPGEEDSGLTALGGRQIPGDANQDAFIDIGDAVRLLILLFVNGQELPCGGANVDDGANASLMDLNGASGVGLDDVFLLLNFLFNDGPAAIRGTSCQRIEGCPDVCSFF